MKISELMDLLPSYGITLDIYGKNSGLIEWLNTLDNDSDIDFRRTDDGIVFEVKEPKHKVYLLREIENDY